MNKFDPENRLEQWMIYLKQLLVTTKYTNQRDRPLHDGKRNADEEEAYAMKGVEAQLGWIME